MSINKKAKFGCLFFAILSTFACVALIVVLIFALKFGASHISLDPEEFYFHVEHNKCYKQCDTANFQAYNDLAMCRFNCSLCLIPSANPNACDRTNSTLGQNPSDDDNTPWFGNLVITVETANIYSTNDANSEVLETSHKGAEWAYFGYDDSFGFFKVQMPSGIDGFILTGSGEIAHDGGGGGQPFQEAGDGRRAQAR